MAKNSQPTVEDILELEQDTEIFVFANKLMPIGNAYDGNGNKRPDREYPRQRSIPLNSSIVWRGGVDPWSGKERPAGRYMTRYYTGCTTLFADDQPKEQDVIDRLLIGTTPVILVEGYVEIPKHDAMLLRYLNEFCSWNADQKNRNPKASAIFRKLDMEKIAQSESEELDAIEEALLLAKKASVKHMKIHAKFLGIPEYDIKSNAKFTVEAIRAKYRKKATENPKRFIETYNDKTILTKAWVEKAMETGEIDFTIIPNKAVWKSKGAIICDVSGINSHEGRLQRLLEFSQLPEGEEFLVQLKGLYS